MQVATFFQDKIALIGSVMNSTPESFISLEEKPEKTDESPDDDNTMRNNLPLSVSTLVNLASTVLNNGEIFVKRKDQDPADDELKRNEDNEDEIQSQCEEYSSETLCNKSDKGDKEKINQTFSPLSIDIKDLPTNITNHPESPHLECSMGTKDIHSLYKYTLNGSDADKNVSSSHAVSFEDSSNTLINTFSMQTSGGGDIVTNSVNSSSMIASNIRETNGCATNVSDMDKVEAENLVIHEQNHPNKIPIRTSENDLDINQLLDSSRNGQCNKEQADATDPTQGQDDQQSQLINQVHSREDQDQPVNKCAKNSDYPNHHNFPECMQSDENVEDLSNQNHQQMSDSQIDGIEKMLHMPENMNLNSHIDTMHQYQHLHESQDHMHHQQTHQFFVHDQQHLMHLRHQQNHHHSDLMEYLHHQDQSAMQQPHHIRTYQHFQQHQQQRIPQLSYPQTSSPQQSQKHGHLTCIDDLMIDEFHEDASNRYKMLSPTVKHESQDDGYETCAGDVLTPNSHSSSHSMTPQHQLHSINLLRSKCDNIAQSHQSDQDPYHFIDDEMNSNIRIVSPSSNGVPIGMHHHSYESSPDVVTALRMEGQHIADPNNSSRMQSSKTNDISSDVQAPKKRGRKKKCNEDISERPTIDSNLKPNLHKERKKHDRFNGMPEEEVSKRTLPDHLANNLDIIIIGINPGLFAAYKGHHYAGPGNHFWKCLYLSGLTHEQMTAEEDYKLLKIGIGFTNMVERATKGSADLTRKEIKEGSRILLEKLKRFRPKIAVFNGKLIFEVFSGKKDFNFGRQQECVEGTDTYMWVMPSSSARCAQLPRAADKVPFYAALKKFRDYLNGLIPNIDDIECVFNDPKSKLCCESDTKGGSLSSCTHFLSPGCPSSEKELGYTHSSGSTIDGNSVPELSANQHKNMQDDSSSTNAGISNTDNSAMCNIILQGLNSVNNINVCNNVTPAMSIAAQPEKKKRGRPKKIKVIDGGEGSVPQKIRNTNSISTNNNNILNLTLLGAQGETPKKKRGRPKKIKIDSAVILKSDQIANNSNNKGGQVIGTNSMNNDIIANNNVCCSPNPNAMNTCSQFNSQSMSRPQPLQNQRLFASPLHSPDTASSYCSVGINVTTPPTANLNNSNGNYHQHLGISPLSHHPQNHILQRPQHQLHSVPGIYLQSPNDTLQQRPKSPHYGSTHSDLSAEISAAISSDHLCETQSEASPAVAGGGGGGGGGGADYERPSSATNDDMRFSSPSTTAVERVNRSNHQIQHYHNIYQNGNSSQDYITASDTARLNEATCVNTSDENIGYNINTPTQASNSNTNTPQPANNPSQQDLHVSDMSSKSLSGLESLVEQIPTISDAEAQNHLTSITGTVECRLKSDADEQYSSPTSSGNDTGSAISGGLGCIYVPTYSNLNSSTPSPSSSLPSSSSIISPHHYPDPTYSTANTCPPVPVSNGRNVHYSSLASNFTVSSLTSNSYSPNSYHTNMTAPVVSSPHHITVPVSGNNMYMDSHLPVAVGAIYPHPYAQHAYGAYNPVTPSPQPPPALHMPSPNYPYTYANNSGYQNEPTHHTNHTTATGYFTSHSSMFDRIKPDIGYGGY